jgi:diguanylate cyclase (GGDEF)-like protein
MAQSIARHGRQLWHLGLLASMRALSGRLRAGTPAPADLAPQAGEPVRLIGATELGVAEQELTAGVRASIRQLIDEVLGLRRQLAAAQNRVAELERLADEDWLMPIRNRRAFLRELARALADLERYGVPWGLMYFDLDGLKAINDRFGHEAGDAALIHVAGVLTANSRGSDVVGRLGGDEFGVLLARADQAMMLTKARGLAEAIAASQFRWEGRLIPLTVAYGTYGLRAGLDTQAALAAADRAMYRDKHNTARADGSSDRLPLRR